MKFSLPGTILLVAPFIAGCQTKPPPRDIIINLTSALPVSYSGVVKVDGKEQAVSGATPAQLTFRAHRVDCQIEQGAENGTLTIEIRPAGAEEAPVLSTWDRLLTLDVITGRAPEHLGLVTASSGPRTVAAGSASF